MQNYFLTHAFHYATQKYYWGDLFVKYLLQLSQLRLHQLTISSSLLLELFQV